MALFPALSFADDVDAQLDAERESQTATAITIIFDSSGSMDDRGKMVQAKAAFTQWLAEVPESYRLSLIAFDRGVARLFVPFGDSNREAVLGVVKSIRPYGKTPLAGCLVLAGEGIKERRSEHSPYERHVVIAFTDGKETVDRRKNAGVVEEIHRLRNHTVEVVGIGFHGEGDYMEPAATSYFHAKDEKELLAGLSQVDAEIGDDSDIEVSEKDWKLISSTEIPIPAPPAAQNP
ncbi:MAG: vWA domain-containing protein [Verrucomicrobiota bacterium]